MTGFLLGLNFRIWFTAICHPIAAVACAAAENWLALVWVIAASVWAIAAFANEREADTWKFRAGMWRNLYTKEQAPF